ncbi:MAG: 50S ribosomal protein L9 [Acidimicrobiia bacterium]|jgi:large subunit ribosomal protein L9|nr:50S ribosomal protein L9 [Acidimicrobiia bacterium]GDX29735.1 50S ribosomal protein L9 [Actinomycetes bacterium]
MKIVLREDVEHVGNKGDIVTVADGYARNYLVPRGLAMKATRGVTVQAEAMRRNRSERNDRDMAAAAELAAELGAMKIEIAARASEGGALFGSVTAAEIASAVTAMIDGEIERRQVELASPIKVLGPAEVGLRLHPEVLTPITIEVVAG